MASERVLPVVCVLGGFVAGCIALALSPLLDVVERSSWDTRQRVFARAGDQETVLVLLDQPSLDWGESAPRHWSWPWPREVYGLALEFFASGGAREAIFDVLVTEPSLYGKSDDAALADALGTFAEHAGAAAAVMPSNSPIGLTGWPAAARSQPRAVDPRGLDVPVFSRAHWPVAPLLGAAPNLGHVLVQPDADQVVRRIHPLVSVADRPLVLLGAAASGGDVRVEAGRFLGSGLEAPLDAEGRMLLRYRAPRLDAAGRRGWPYRTYSMAAVIESALLLREGRSPTLSPSLFDGARVLVGLSAPGLVDIRATPFGPSQPGVLIHATAADNLRTGDALYEPHVALRLAYTPLLCVLVAVAVLVSPRGFRAIPIVVLAIAAPLVIGAGAFVGGVAMPMATPLFGVLLTLGGLLQFAFAMEGRRRRFLRQAFGRYLSQSVIEGILRDPSSLVLGGERRTLTIFFSDLQGFSAIAERLDPQELVEVLNDYLSLMTAEILDEGGTIDKFEGDAIIAFWGAPLRCEDHAARAVRAAIRCQRVLDAHRARFEGRTELDFEMRIGLHTGPVVVGNMGSNDRFDYTVLGDAANLASRLEGANKVFRSRTLMSEETWRAAKRHDDSLLARPLGKLRVYGRSANTTVYEPLESADEAALDLFDKAFRLGEAGRWLEARELYASRAEDPCAEACVRTIETQIDELDTWDGTWEMRTK